MKFYDFLRGNMVKNKNINESDMLSRLHIGAELLCPLLIEHTNFERQLVDGIVDVRLPGGTELFRFAVESKSRSTPEAFRTAVQQARSYAVAGESLPLIQVPYLSPERLAELEELKVSGIDLCGNGFVMVQNRIFILRTGNPNQYPDSRPLANPFRGRSAMVARMLVEQPEWSSQKLLAEAIRNAGVELSNSQVSKAISALSEDLYLTKTNGKITLKEPLRLLDELSRGWQSHRYTDRRLYRMNSDFDWSSALNSESTLQWTITGESSVVRYTMFGQGGPTKIAVSNLLMAERLIDSVPENIPSFADLEMLETSEDGCFFLNDIDERGASWAGKLQTWIELTNGDARQQEAADDLRDQLLKDARR